MRGVVNKEERLFVLFISVYSGNGKHYGEISKEEENFKTSMGKSVDQVFSRGFFFFIFAVECSLSKLG